MSRERYLMFYYLFDHGHDLEMLLILGSFFKKFTIEFLKNHLLQFRAYNTGNNYFLQNLE